MYIDICIAQFSICCLSFSISALAISMSCSKEAMSFSKEFVKEFEGFLNKKKGKPNEVLKGCLDVLHAHHISYEVEKLNPKLILPHKFNRGGLMLSHHNVHSNAVKIAKAGARLDALSNALAFEIGEGAQRQAHIDKNIKLVKRADGLIAAVTQHARA